MSQELTEEEQAEFSVLYGFLFSLSLVNEYFDGAEPIINDKGNNYIINKLKQAHKGCIEVNKVMEREFTKTMSEVNKKITLDAIEDQKEFAYSLFLLDATEQNRVRSLIKKIQRGK